jgi:hypothetical protein
MPLGSKIISVKFIDGDIVLFAMADPNESVNESYIVQRTGPDKLTFSNVESYTFLDTVVCGDMPMHIFYKRQVEETV